MSAINNRYQAVKARITHHLDEAAKRRPAEGIAVSLGHTWLAAKLFIRNEEARMQAEQARANILASMAVRIQTMEAHP